MAEVVANGLRTHVQRLGDESADRPAVLFVHGIVVDNLSSLYFTLAPHVSKLTHTVLYDLRGHGKTERPPSGYGLDGLLADLEGVLEAEALSGPVILIGHSYGGLLAISFALRHPERVAGLALVDPPLPLAGWGPNIADIFGIKGEERDRRIREAYDTMHGSRETRKRRRLAATANALVGDTTLLADMRASPDFTEKEIGQLQCPVLAIYGDGSEIIESARTFQRLLPEAQVEILPGCTHLVLFEDTNKVQELILTWLQQTWPEGGR